jgi:hypothetical protein
MTKEGTCGNDEKALPVIPFWGIALAVCWAAYEALGGIIVPPRRERMHFDVIPCLFNNLERDCVTESAKLYP